MLDGGNCLLEVSYRLDRAAIGLLKIVLDTPIRSTLVRKALSFLVVPTHALQQGPT